MNPPLILIIDDNPITRTAVRAALEGEGYTVVEAEDGRSALEQMAESRPDLVLQDLLLPDMDGCELARRLRTLSGRVPMPILAFSSSRSRIDQARSLQAGFTGYLCKPVPPSQLRHTIQVYLPLTRTAPIAQEPPGRGRRLLVAHDDPIQRQLLTIHLEQRGFRVTTVEDGAQALDQLWQSCPDAIVSDVLMPRLDGFRLCQAVRQDPQLARVPVVLISAAYTEEADRQLARAVGANALVLCTPDLQEVTEAVLASLQEEPPLLPERPVESWTEAYTGRVLRQLERQAGLNVSLTHRLASLEAKLTILAGVAETLKNTGAMGTVLDDLLQRCLDASGASRGAAYLLEPNGQLVLRAQPGYPPTAEEPLPEFFGHADWLRHVMEEGEPVEVPSSSVPGDLAGDLLERAGARSLLVVPLVLGTERLGVLMMALERQGLGEEWVPFAKAIGSQIGQTIGLARAHSGLQEAGRRKDEFLAMLAHELRNPLGAISNATQVLKRSGPDEPRAGTPWVRAVETIERQVQHQARLIDDLLNVTRIICGKIVLRSVPLDLVQLVHATAEDHRRALEEAGLTLNLELPQGPLWLEGDPTRLAQILENLLDNARRFTDPGGEVGVQVFGCSGAQGDRAEPLNTRTPEHLNTPFAVVTVRDTGIGIDPEILPHLFETFTQADRSLDRSRGGLGLGLPLVKGLVEMHGGEVTAESAGLGHGAAFRFRLPLMRRVMPGVQRALPRRP